MNEVINYSAVWDLSKIMDKDKLKDLLFSFLEKEDDVMPILKEYLVGYLDKIMKDPDPIIKDLIKEKDNEINELRIEVERLKSMVDALLYHNINLTTSSSSTSSSGSNWINGADGNSTWIY